jgi:hypothetical protein
VGGLKSVGLLREFKRILARGSSSGAFVCHVREELNEKTRNDWRKACEEMPLYAEHEGKRYCVLHFPGEDKKDDFKKARRSKLAQKDYDFSGTVFPEGTSDFREFVFDADAVFNGASFVGEADFSSAKFSGERTFFSGAQFSGEQTFFLGAQFDGEWTYFSTAQFSGAETDFKGATFMKEVDLNGATFKEKASFLGNQGNTVFDSGAWASFNDTRIEKPEQFTFNTMLLYPGWFINADVRKVGFTDVQWYGMRHGPQGTLGKEIAALKVRRGTESPCLC